MSPRREPEAVEVALLYNLIGKAIWHLQHVEHALSISLTLKLDLKEARRNSVDAAIAGNILDKNRRMTLGRAVKLAAENCIYSPPLLEELKALLGERNWLVHNLVHESGDMMNIEGGREDLFARIDDLEESSHKIQRMISDDLLAFVQTKGISEEEIMTTAINEVRKAHGEA